MKFSRRLNQAKAMLQHGEWQKWLQDNFNLSQSTAQRFMKCAERFGKSATLRDLNYGQMIQILSLPAGEEEKFIAEKAAEGKAVEDMTVKRFFPKFSDKKEVVEWKSQNCR